LRNACAADDWEYSGIMEEHEPVFGVFDGSQLVAAASMGAWYEHLRFAGVITHPEYRSRGNGLAAAAAITAHGLMQGHIMQWHTHMTNEPSLRIARRLGYQQVYEAVGVRLLTESRPFPQTAAPVLERWAEAQAQRESPVMPSTTESAPTLFA
jgi:GNAT superfamily N-acetyltransferase